MLNTKADVFIIESLDPDDEGNGRFEGAIISSVLRLHGKEPKYRYVRTREQFEDAVKEFGRSRYRYLHISAHGDPEGMVTTNQEEIDYDELSSLLRPRMRNKRPFLSACSMVHEDLAKHLIPGSGCYSVIGPDEDIHFHRAAIFWASLYHLMFWKDSEKFTRRQLQKALLETSNLFEVKVRFFYRNQDVNKLFGESLIASRSRKALPTISSNRRIKRTGTAVRAGARIPESET
jgi:hypothetical protein